MKKISRHRSPFSRNRCAVRATNNSRRERKWIGRMNRKRFFWNDWAGRWMQIGLNRIAAIESGNAE